MAKFVDTTFQERYSERSYSDTIKTGGMGILKVIFLLILTSLVFRFLQGTDTNLTFTGFLNWLKDFKPIIKNAVYVDNTIGGYWSIADGIRLFLNVIIRAFDVVVWACKNLVNMVSYGTGIVAFLFGI